MRIWRLCTALVLLFAMMSVYGSVCAYYLLGIIFSLNLIQGKITYMCLSMKKIGFNR